MTVGLFYTARGRSPQQKGIIPDIILPDQNHLIASGERCTWPKLEMIRQQTRISRTLREILQRYEKSAVV